MTVLRRLDCVLQGTKAAVLTKYEQSKTLNIQNIDPILNKVAGYNFHNRSNFTFDSLIADPNNIAANLIEYINGFSTDAREIIEQFEFDNQITRMEQNQDIFSKMMDDKEFGGVKSYMLKKVYKSLNA